MLMLSALSLAACGFQPLHGTSRDGSGSTAKQYADIAVANIPDQNGQYLRNLLIDRIYLDGRPADPRYVLQINNLKRDISDIGIRKDATYTRALMEITAELVLIDTVTNESVLVRDLRATGSYNLLDNQFASYVSRDSLTDRLLDELGDSAMTALDIYLHNKATHVPVSNEKTIRLPQRATIEP